MVLSLYIMNQKLKKKLKGKVTNGKKIESEQSAP